MLNWRNTRRILYCSISFAIISCSGSTKSELKFQDSNKKNESLQSQQIIFGDVNGLNYTIITGDDALYTSQREIEQLLINFQSVVSNEQPNSFIYKFNHSTGQVITLNDTFHYFQDLFQFSQEIYHLTNGAFNPCAQFITKKWGFDKAFSNDIDSIQVSSFMKDMDFEAGHLYSMNIGENNLVSLKKKNNHLTFDFSDISSGLAVDYICEFLSKKGNKNYFIEIEGKRKVKGRNKDGLQWQIGIDIPKKSQDGRESVRDFTKVVDIKSGAIATAGNYNSFYMKDNEKRSYTIDPRTGFPVDHSILSATVWSDKCTTSDAYSHVFMVMGVNEIIEFLKNNPALNIELMLIYNDENGNLTRFETPGMQRMLGH